MSTKKNEGSTTADLVTKMGTSTDLNQLQGFGSDKGSFRTGAGDSPVQKHRKKKPVNKKLQTKGFKENLLKQCIIECLNETVRKQGNLWILLDDETGSQVGAFKSRKDAWAQQRIRRIDKKNKKKKNAPDNPPQDKNESKQMNKISMHELKNIIREELFGEPEDTEKMKVKLKAWDKGEPEKKVDWVKDLDLKEFFGRKEK